MLLEHSAQFTYAFINTLEFEPCFWFKLPDIVTANLYTTSFPPRPACGGLKFSVGIFLKIGSDFNQKVPPEQPGFRDGRSNHS